uniref:F-box domain-containing protein n=1 Tax=Leersia perrieri TaxID=77586 RepID=A0A0D9UXI0_9ORYZ
MADSGKRRGRRMRDLPEEVLLEVLCRVGNVKQLFMLAATCRWCLHRGVVLMKLVPRTGTDGAAAATTTTTNNLLGVCNPITGERHVLPRLIRVAAAAAAPVVTSYAIITPGDLNNQSRRRSTTTTFSQLLVILTTRLNDVYLYSYCAATRKWTTTPTVCPGVDLRRFSLAGEKSAVPSPRRGALALHRHHPNLLRPLQAQRGCRGHDARLLHTPPPPPLVAGSGTALLHVGASGDLAVPADAAKRGVGSASTRAE